MINPKTIVKIGRQTKILDVADHLQINNFFNEEGVFKSQIHSKYSRINFTLVDVTDGKKEKSKVLSFNMKAEEFGIFLQYFSSFKPEDYKKISMELNKKYFSKDTSYYSFMKVNPYIKKKQGNLNLIKVDIFSITYETQLRSDSKWKLQFETGWAIGEEKGMYGGKRIVPKNYEKEDRAFINLTKDELKEIIVKVRKYISLWEQYAFPKMMEYRLSFEERFKENNYNELTILKWNSKAKKNNNNKQQSNNVNNNTDEQENNTQGQKQRKPVQLTEVITCEDCEALLTEDQIEYSIQEFGECLCTECIKKKQMES